jgi:hypothetical protein
MIVFRTFIFEINPLISSHVEFIAGIRRVNIASHFDSALVYSVALIMIIIRLLLHHSLKASYRIANAQFSSLTREDGSHLLRALTSSRAPDDLLDQLLDRIPIAGINGMEVRLEVVGNEIELLPALLVVNKGQSNTNTSKSTSATDSMKIGLRIRLLAVRHGWNILLMLVGYKTLIS